jgi:preprotein translocase SecE subunit
LATKAKKPAAKRTSTTKVTRITASDAPTPKTPAVQATKQTNAASTKRSFLQNLAVPFIAIGTYFAGSWYELRQVNWTDRKATWSLTLAMLLFTGFFAALILLLDALFKYLFQLILG